MAYFTGILVLANIIGLGLIWRQGSISKEALEATERAWVVGIPEKIYITNDMPKNFAVVMRLRNSGKGPGFEVVHEVIFTTDLTPPRQQVRSTPGTEPTELTIGGGITTDEIIPYPKSWTIADKAVESVERGALTMYVWLRVIYRDPVGGDRYTQECWKYNREFRRLVFCGPGTQIHR